MQVLALSTLSLLAGCASDNSYGKHGYIPYLSHEDAGRAIRVMNDEKGKKIGERYILRENGETIYLYDFGKDGKLERVIISRRDAEGKFIGLDELRKDSEEFAVWQRKYDDIRKLD